MGENLICSVHGGIVILQGLIDMYLSSSI
jgi:hypothetical protein